MSARGNVEVAMQSDAHCAEESRIRHYGAEHAVELRKRSDAALAAVRELVEAAKATRDNFRCVLRVNCKCDDEFIDAQTARLDAALSAVGGAQ